VNTTAHPSSNNEHRPSTNQEELVHQEMQRATIVILGAHGSGKTSLTRQFVLNEFTDVYKTTRSLYYVSLIVNERIYEARIIIAIS